MMRDNLEAGTHVTMIGKGGDEILTSTDAKGMGGDTAVLFGVGGNDLLYVWGFSNDKLSGGNGNDQIHAGVGNDKLWGGKGKDFFDGGEGNDVLFGSKGKDTFLFYDEDNGFDCVKDFNAMKDPILIDTQDRNATGILSVTANGVTTDLANSNKFKVWHHYMPEFREALENNDKEAFTRSVNKALGADHIVRKGDMLIEGNDHGRAYNSMGQSDMGLALIKAGRKWGVTEWVNDGIAALEVMLTKYEAGGLRLRDADSDTAWYCGQTARHHTDKGGTLNKHLYATRTFFNAAKQMEALGMTGKAAEYKEAGEEGFLKLVKGKQAPQLKDFFVQKDNGDYYFKSWVYYACGDADKERTYFLDQKQKNANYHLFDMKLIHTIGQLVDDDFKFKPFYKEQLEYVSAFGGMLQVYENKLDMGGLDNNTRTSYGQFTSTLNGSDDALDSSVTDWFGLFL